MSKALCQALCIISVSDNPHFTDEEAEAFQRLEDKLKVTQLASGRVGMRTQSDLWSKFLTIRLTQPFKNGLKMTHELGMFLASFLKDKGGGLSGGVSAYARLCGGSDSLLG